MRTPTILLATYAAMLIGCDQFRPAPLLPTSQLPSSIARIETLTFQIIQQFENGNAKGADPSLHQLPSLFGVVERLAAQSQYPESNKVAMNRASRELMKVFAVLEEQAHRDQISDDFDFAPVRKKLVDGIYTLRSALPPNVAAMVVSKAEKKGITFDQASSPTAGPTAPTDP